MASRNDTVLGTLVMNVKHFEDEIQGFEVFYRSTKTFSLLVGIEATVNNCRHKCVWGGVEGVLPAVEAFARAH